MFEAMTGFETQRPSAWLHCGEGDGQLMADWWGRPILDSAAAPNFGLAIRPTSRVVTIGQTRGCFATHRIAHGVEPMSCDCPTADLTAT